MIHTLKISEIVNRKIIRNDKSEEFLNKMTDEEIEIYFKEIEHSLNEEEVEHKFPDWNVAVLAKIIDRSILYNFFIDNDVEKHINKPIIITK